MGRIALKHIFLMRYYLQFISRYAYLWSTRKKILCNPPPPQGVNSAPNVSKLYTFCGIDISKCIEGGSMKLATQEDNIYICKVWEMSDCKELNICNNLLVLHLDVWCIHKLYYFIYVAKSKMCIDVWVYEWLYNV